MGSSAVLPEGPSMGAVQVAPHPVVAGTPTLLDRVIAMWEAIQINNRGKYSTKRMAALRDYSRQTSFARALAVCILTPLPALLVLIAIESLPLRNPTDGWSANYVAWLRIFFTTISAGAGSVCQIHGMVTTISLPWKTVAAIAITTAGGCTLAVMTISALSVFPLPFAFILTTIPFQMFFVATFRLATRHQVFSHLSVSLKQAVFLVVIQVILAPVYAGFSVMFESSTPTLQTVLILLLAVIKSVMKNLVAWLSAHSEDLIPVVVVFTAEMFNALYVSICMQMAVSGWTAALVIVLDAAQALLSLVEIHYSTGELRSAQEKTPQRSRRALSMVLRGRVRSGAHPDVASVVKVHPSLGPSAKAAESRFDSSMGVRLNTITRARRCTTTRSGFKTVNEVQRLMFHSEYLMLVEYIECAIPALYAVYLLALSQTASAQYYPHARSLGSEKLWTTVGSLALYAVLEALALVGLHLVLKRKFGFSPLHQLAFVLETDAGQVQGRLFVWIVGLPQFTLAHFGADFSFRFEWIRSKAAL